MKITAGGLGMWLIVLGFLDDSLVSIIVGLLLVTGALVIV